MDEDGGETYQELHFIYDVQGRPAFEEFEGVKHRYVYNLQGDVVAIVDAFGNPVVEYKYDAWGKHIFATSETGIGVINPFRYRGYMWDAETERYYLLSRYYNPQNNRFMNIDAIVKAKKSCLGINLIAYCSNNPIKFSDSLGTAEKVAYKKENIYYYPGASEDCYNVELIIHVPYNEDIENCIIGHVEIAMKYDGEWRVYSYGPSSTSGLTLRSGASDAYLTVRSREDLWGNREEYNTYVLRMWAFPGAIENTITMIAADINKPFISKPLVGRYKVTNIDFYAYSLVENLGKVCRDYANKTLQSLGYDLLESAFDAYYPSSLLRYIKRFSKNHNELSRY